MTGESGSGRLIGSGRAADVCELDGGRVLRRYRMADAGLRDRSEGASLTSRET